MTLLQIEKLIKQTEADLKRGVEMNATPIQIEAIESDLSRYRLYYKQVQSGAIKLPEINVKAILQRLGELDLKSNPVDEAKMLIDQLKTFPIMNYTLMPEGEGYYADSMIRARPYKKTEPTFTVPMQLNYKPQEYNSNYQRASTKDKTVFYGCLKRINGELITQSVDGKELDNRFVATMEAMSMLRDINSEKKVAKVAHGKWVVMKPIKLVAIVGGKDSVLNNPGIKKMYDAFKEKVSEIDMLDEAIAIADFFADQFANKEAGNGKEHLYMLSALFSEAWMNTATVDGIFYPSVRTEYQGICIALNVNAAESKIKLIGAGEAMVYKNKDKGIIDNLTFVDVPLDATSYTFKQVDSQYMMGEKQALVNLGLTSFDELKYA